VIEGVSTNPFFEPLFLEFWKDRNMTVQGIPLEPRWRSALRVDRVVLAIVALLAATAALSLQQLEASLAFAATGVIHIAPFLLGAVAIAAYLKAAGAERLIARLFSGRVSAMVVSASLFGALSPFCSCGVIPLIAALLSLGVPLAPVMAFWVSSPVMSPDVFVLTAGVLGTGFAVAKTLAAIGVGLLAGFATLVLQRTRFFREPLRPGVGDGGCAGSAVRNPQAIVWRFWSEPARRSVFAQSTRQTGVFLTKWLALAFVLESLMLAYVPAEAIASQLGGDSAWAIPLAVLVGVPAYMNGYAAIPVVAGLMSAGMAPGAALAFMTAGAMTSIPAAVAVFALVRRPIFLWYLALALLGAGLSGMLYQLAVSAA
jgi:uncharacterized membrane protein YraQ (UPF0718 family)